MYRTLCWKGDADDLEPAVPDESASSPRSVGVTSLSLLSRVRSRDQEAWRKLVWLYGPLVNFWLRRSGLQDADVQDLFQEVFAAVAGSIDRFRRDRADGTFRGWLRTIVNSKVMDHHRRRKHQPRGEGGTEAQGRLMEREAHEQPPALDHDDAPAIRDLRLRGLELVRGEFEPRTWQMFWQVAVDCRAAADVARDMNVSPSAVRLAKSRVLRRLREELGDLEP